VVSSWFFSLRNYKDDARSHKHKTFNLCSFLNESEQVSHPHKTTDKIIFPYILFFIFLDRKVEVKRFCTEIIIIIIIVIIKVVNLVVSLRWKEMILLQVKKKSPWKDIKWVEKIR